MRIGANPLNNGEWEFMLWSPFAGSVRLEILSPSPRIVPLERVNAEYWRAVIDSGGAEITYRYLLDDLPPMADPASHFQPEGVHGPSRTVDHTRYSWKDAGWAGIPLPEIIFYELHVGTFTPEGTFDAVIGRLDDLAEIGINTIEIMPVAQFPGERNWGYDGVFPYSAQDSYGGPESLRSLVEACHVRGMAAALDVVYNHQGPEGSVLRDFGPYFTDRYKTPWGDAVNYDGPYSDGVRNYFIENALHWIGSYHFDALRLDAIHGIYDLSASPFLAELTAAVDASFRDSGRKIHLIAESDLNDTKVVRSRETGGYVFDAQWLDGYHHAIHTLLTGERMGYYEDYGEISHFTTALREGYVYSGQYSLFRKRRFGNSSRDISADRFVVFTQNHDQTGNRMLGERLAQLLPFDARKLAAGAVLLSPYIPLLFMGEEYGEDAPFQYFISHQDPYLVQAVREGRKREFAAFLKGEEIPDAQSGETFQRSKLRWESRNDGAHGVLLRFFRTLIELRKRIPALSHLDKHTLDVWQSEAQKTVWFHRWNADSHILCILNFQDRVSDIPLIPPEGSWRIILDSAASEWLGPGSTLPGRMAGETRLTIPPHTVALYEREESV